MYLESEAEYDARKQYAMGVWTAVLENSEIVDITIDNEHVDAVLTWGVVHVRDLVEDTYGMQVMGVISPSGDLVTEF